MLIHSTIPMKEEDCVGYTAEKNRRKDALDTVQNVLCHKRMHIRRRHGRNIHAAEEVRRGTPLDR